MANKCRFCGAKTDHENGVCAGCNTKYYAVRRFMVAAAKFKEDIGYADIQERRAAERKAAAEELFKVFLGVTVDGFAINSLFPAGQLHQICEQLVERGVTFGEKK